MFRFAVILAGCGSEDPAPPSGACDPAIAAPIPRQLRLLSRREYDRSIADLFPALAGGGECLDDSGCAIELESCVGGTCRPDPCELVTFLLPSDGHEGSVSVAGSFDAWDPTAWPMTYLPEHGAWVRKQVVTDGRYPYKFVVDGAWITDPGNPVVEDDGYGGQNSVLVQACADAAPSELGFHPSDGFPIESPPTGFPFDVAAETGLVTTVHASLYGEAAASIAAAATTDLAGLLGCTSPIEACLEPWVRAFGRRVFRRTLSDDEVDRYLALAASQPALADGVSVAVAAFLQSPLFLYRSEVGAPAPDGFTLEGWEIAGAMAYLAWGAPPDDALLSMGESGALADPEARAAEMERMLLDPRARQTVEAFAVQWLDVAGAPNLIRVDPAFTPALGEGMVRSAAHLVADTTFDGPGTFDALLTSSTAWADADLAAVLGAAPPAGAEGLVELPPERRGILGQAGVLAANAHSDQTSPIRRALFVRERLLCETLPIPPPGVGIVPSVSIDDTTRDRFEQHTADPFCASCHVRIDPVGFGMESFDAIGRYRTEENGLPIDTSGWVADLDGADVPFEGALELGQVLAASDAPRRCYATQWWRFAAGRLETPAQACALDALHRAFDASGGDLRELMVDLVRQPDFVRRSP
ncbi:MAG: DUF1588 domain-containing protein [Myxococcota bacterium]